MCKCWLYKALCCSCLRYITWLLRLVIVDQSPHLYYHYIGRWRSFVLFFITPKLPPHLFADFFNSRIILSFHTIHFPTFTQSSPHFFSAFLSCLHNRQVFEMSTSFLPITHQTRKRVREKGEGRITFESYIRHWGFMFLWSFVISKCTLLIGWSIQYINYPREIKKGDGVLLRSRGQAVSVPRRRRQDWAEMPQDRPSGFITIKVYGFITADNGGLLLFIDRS